LTDASVTPGTAASARCTRDWHAAHVIPITGNEIELPTSSVVPASIRVATSSTSTLNLYTPLPYLKEPIHCVDPATLGSRTRGAHLALL
jgi:hypothetical protein